MSDPQDPLVDILQDCAAELDLATYSTSPTNHPTKAAMLAALLAAMAEHVELQFGEFLDLLATTHCLAGFGSTTGFSWTYVTDSTVIEAMRELQEKKE